MQERKQTGKKKDAYSRQRRRRSCEAHQPKKISMFHLSL